MPTLNANGMVYAADYQNDQIVTLDPLRNATDAIDVPTRQDKSTMQPTGPPSMPLPSPFWGENIIWDSVAGPHSVMMDEKGRVWTSSTIRSSANPDFCKEGSDNPYARYFPLKSSGKQVIMYDPETKQFKMVDTCFSTHHLQFAQDKEDTLFFSAPGKPEVGWLDTQMLAKTGDAEKSQGWCPAYLDTKGTGQIDPAVDRRIDISSYGLVVNPVDQSVWLASPGVPTRIIRVSRGSMPPSTCSAELYQPPSIVRECPVWLLSARKESMSTATAWSGSRFQAVVNLQALTGANAKQGAPPPRPAGNARKAGASTPHLGQR